MTDDNDDAREALKAEAERLRLEREARDRDADQAKRDVQSHLAALAKSYSERRFWSSVTRFTGPLLFTTIGSAALFWGMSVDFEQEKNPSRVPYGLIWTCLILAVVVLVRYVVYGPWRFHRWRSALPFPVEGLTEALGSRRAATKVKVVLEFSDSVAPKDVLEELVRGKLPLKEDEQPPQVSVRDRVVEVTKGLSSESANWPLHGWFRALAGAVLGEVHRAWPLAKVRVEVLETDAFYIPGGD